MCLPHLSCDRGDVVWVGGVCGLAVVASALSPERTAAACAETAGYAVVIEQRY